MALRARSDRSDPSAPEPPADKAPETRDAECDSDDPGPVDVDAAMTWASTDRQSSGRIEQRRRLPDLRVAALTPPVIAIRWGALAVGFALASADVADGDVRVLVFGGIILAYAVFRTLRPISYEDGPGTVWSVLAELRPVRRGRVAHGLLGVAVRLLADDGGDRRRLRPWVHVRHQLCPGKRRRRRDPVHVRAEPRATKRSGGRPSGPSCCFSWRWSPATPDASSPSQSASSRWPSIDSGGSSRPTSCSSRSTESPSPCRRRSTSTTSSTPR